MKIPFSSHSLQHILLSDILIKAILIAEVITILILIHIFLIVILNIYSCAAWPSVCFFGEISRCSAHLCVCVGGVIATQ